MADMGGVRDIRKAETWGSKARAQVAAAASRRRPPLSACIRGAALRLAAAGRRAGRGGDGAAAADVLAVRARVVRGGALLGSQASSTFCKTLHTNACTSNMGVRGMSCYKLY